MFAPLRVTSTFRRFGGWVTAVAALSFVLAGCSGASPAPVDTAEPASKSDVCPDGMVSLFDNPDTSKALTCVFADDKKVYDQMQKQEQASKLKEEALQPSPAATKPAPAVKAPTPDDNQFDNGSEPDVYPGVSPRPIACTMPLPYDGSGQGTIEDALDRTPRGIPEAERGPVFENLPFEQSKSGGAIAECAIAFKQSSSIEK